MIQHLYYIIIIIALIIAINNFNYNKITLYLIGYILIITLYFLLHYALFSYQSVYLIAILYKHFYPIFYLPGAFLYLYIKKNIFEESLWKRIDFIHFIPFFIAIINIFPYYLIDFSDKLIYAEKIIQDSDFSIFNEFQILYPYSISSLIRIILFVTYTSISSKYLYIYWKNKYKSKKSSGSKNLFKWLVFLNATGILLIICLGILTKKFYIFLDIEKLEINSNFFTLFAAFIFFLIVIVLLFYPQVTYGIPISIYSKREDVNNTRCPIPDLKEKIINYFEDEKPYQNMSFSIDDFAVALDIPKNYIYGVFQNDLKIKFTEFRSNYRVEHAKKILLESTPTQVSLKEVWTSSGFSSKTTFFSAFKKKTGLTPFEFVKNNSKKKY